MILLKQSTAVTIVLGPFVDSTDGVTAETALTIAQADVRLSKNAAAFAQKGDATSCTHMENGYYSCPLSTTDTGTLGVLDVAVNEAGALPVFLKAMVVPANAYDSLVGGTDTLQADVTQWLGTAAATPGVPGVPEVATSSISATAVDSIWDEALAGHATAGSAGRTLRIAGGILGEFTVNDAAATTTSFVTTLTNTVDDFYKDDQLAFLSGALAGLCRVIVAYNGTTKAITVEEPMPSAPANGVAFVIRNYHTHPITDISAAVWDEARAGHTTAGTFGEGVASVQGSVGSVAAGGITSTSIATAAIDADSLSTDAVIEIADGVLDRNMATGTDSGSPTVRTVRQALRASRNKVSITAGTATICKEDDVTASWTAAVTTTAGDPISSIDPASI